MTEPSPTSLPAVPPTPPPPPSTLLALLGGVVTLTAMPLALAGLFSFSPNLADAWNEGGSGMYAVLGMVAAGTFLCGVAVFLAGRVWPAAAVAAPLFVILPAAVGRAFTSHVMHGAVLAVSQANPADRLTILMASMGEALWITVFGGVGSAALAFAAALGLALGGLARRKDVNRSASVAMLSAAPALLLIAVAAVVASSAAAAWVEPFKAIAHLAPGDRLTVARGLLEEAAPRERLRLILGLLAALGVVGSAVASRRAPVAAGLMGTSGLLTLGLLLATIRMVLPADLELLRGEEAGGVRLVVVDAPGAKAIAPVLVGSTLPEGFADSLERMRSLYGAAGADSPDVALGITPEATAQAVQDALTTAALGGTTAVELVFSPPPPDKPEPPLPSPFHLLPPPLTGVTVGLGTRGRLCAGDCQAAVLEKDALVVDGERWTLVETHNVRELDYRPLLLLAGAHEPRQLAAAAITALKHERRLTLVVENPRDEAQEDRAPARPRLDVSLEKLSVLGSYNVKSARETVTGLLGPAQRCTAGEELPDAPFTVHLQLSLDHRGGVTQIINREDWQDRWSALELCLIRVVGDAEFPEAPPRGLSVVTLDLAFKAAKEASTKPGK